MGIFKAQGVWQEDYQPATVLFRDEQVSKLTHYLQPVFSACRGYNVLCIGDYGTGKTATVNHVRSMILATGKKVGRKVDIVYINCSRFKAARQSVSVSRLFTSYLQQHGMKAYHTLPSDLLAGMVEKEIRNHDGTVIILDEVDYYILNRINDFDRLAYMTSRIFPATSLILITNKFEVAKYMSSDLDPRVADTFGRNLKTVAFSDYIERELYEILKDRAATGLNDGTYDNDVLEFITSISFNQGWKARGVITLTRESGERAEREGMQKIEKWLVEAVAKQKPIRELESIIATLDPPMKNVLNFLLRMKETKPWVRESDALEWFMSKSSDLRLLSGTSETTFYTAINKLKGMTIIHSERDSKGRGKGVITRIRINPTYIDTVKNALKVEDD